MGCLFWGVDKIGSVNSTALHCNQYDMNVWLQWVFLCISPCVVQPVNTSVETMPLTITYQPISVGKLRMWVSLFDSFQTLYTLGKCIMYVCHFRGHFKNIYGLLNLRALKILYTNQIFHCMGKIFCVEFQRYPLKFHTEYLTHTLKDGNFIQCWKFKSSQILRACKHFWTTPSSFVCLFDKSIPFALILIVHQLIFFYVHPILRYCNYLMPRSIDLTESGVTIFILKTGPESLDSC